MDEVVRQVAATIGVVHSVRLRNMSASLQNGRDPADVRIRGQGEPSGACTLRRAVSPLSIRFETGYSHRHSRKDHVGCLFERFWRKNLRGAWKARSPCMAAIRLNSGVSALKTLVLKGEPCLMSPGYSSRSWSKSLGEMSGM